MITVTSDPSNPLCHVTPILSYLHWLPVKFRIEFKSLLLVFKSLRGLAPTYLNDLITIRTQQRYSLRSTSEFLLNYPKGRMLSTLGDRAFVSAAPSLWNVLPSDISNEYSLCLFKTKLKTFLFNKAFGNV